VLPVLSFKYRANVEVQVDSLIHNDLSLTPAVTPYAVERIRMYHL